MGIKSALIASLLGGLCVACEGPNTATTSSTAPTSSAKPGATWETRFPVLWSVAYADTPDVRPENVTYDQFLSDLAKKLSATAQTQATVATDTAPVDPDFSGNDFGAIQYWWQAALKARPTDTAVLDKSVVALKAAITSHTAREHFLKVFLTTVSKQGGYSDPETETKIEYVFARLTDMYHANLFKQEYIALFVDSAISSQNPFIHPAYHPDIFTGLVLIDKTSQSQSDYYMDVLIRAIKRDYGHTPNDESLGIVNHMSEYSRLCYLAKYAIPQLNVSASKLAELVSAFTGRIPTTVGASDFPRCISIQ